MGKRGCKTGEAWNRIEWTEEQIEFLKANFSTMTNPEISEALGIALTSTRTMAYKLGLKRMDLEYWTKAQVRYLRKHYPTIGDKELAEIFQKRWPKKKGWSLKHIEKKRRYLGLKRTPEMIRDIKNREVAKGTYSRANKKMWAVRGVAAEGEVRYWETHGRRMVPFVKIGDSFQHWARWAWEQKHGAIPKKLNVVFKDGDPYNRSIDNLELITDAELSKRNSKRSSTGLSDNYVAGILTHGDPELRQILKKQPALLELKRKQLQLNRLINQTDKN